MLLWQLVLVAGVLAGLYYRWSRRRLHRLAAEIPSGMKCYPIIGHAYKFLGNSEDQMTVLQEMGRIANRQDGLSSLWLGNELHICVTDPKCIEKISKVCLDKPSSSKFLRAVIGNGSIFAPVPIWHRRRKINAPFFKLKNLNQLVPTFQERSSIMADLMRAEVGGGDFPVWKYMTTYTFDTVCETAVGTKMNSQENPEHSALNAITELAHMISRRILQPWLHPDFVYERLPVYQHFQGQKKHLCNFVDEIVRKKKEELIAESLNKEVNTRTNFLDILIRNGGYSDMELREEVLVMIIAANDTSAVGTSFVAVMLSRFPDVQEKVYQELRKVFDDSDRPVTPEDLPRLKYLEAVIKESLRLYPPVPAAIRKVDRDVVLPLGQTLVDGTNILLNIWATHRHPAYWGADAEQFRPERFLEAAPAPAPHPAQFVAFSHSVRGCIGATYAMFSAKTALATLLRRYRLLPPAGARAADLARPLPVKLGIMMKAVDDFTLRIEERHKTI